MTYTNPRAWSGVSQSTNDPHPGGFIVYINGIEVPAKSVTQRFGVWQIPEMQIEMVADPVLTRLGAEDRVQVVVFYLDDTQPDPSVAPQFRLFGEGEIVAWGYQNTPGGRSIVFTVANQFVVLRQLMVQFLTQVDDYASHAVQLNPSLIGVATSEILFPFSLFTDGLLRSNPAATPETPTTSETVSEATPEAAPGAALAVAIQQAEDLAAALAAEDEEEGEGFVSIYRVALERAKEKVAEAVKAAEAARTAKAEADVAAVSTSVASETVPNQIKRPFDYMYNVVKAMLEKKIPSAVRTVPAANFFTRWARLTNFQNRFAAFPIFDDVEDNNVFPVLKALQGVNALDVLVRRLLPQMQNAGSLFDMLQLVYQTVFMEIAMIPTMPLVKTDLKTGVIEETPFEEHVLVKDPDDETRYVTKKALIPLKPNRIPNYFSKPQLLFSIPPSCNVIFPSQIRMLSYRENYQEQPTRIYFNDGVVNNLLKSQGINNVLISNALAIGYPEAVDVNSQLQVQGGKVNGKNFLLYPEEFFRGPVMDRRPVPPWLFFLRQYEYAENNPLTPSGATPDGTPTVPGGTSVSGRNATAAANSTGLADPNGDSMVGYVWPLPATNESPPRLPFSVSDYQDHLNRGNKNNGRGRRNKDGTKYNEALSAGIDLYYRRKLDGSEPFLKKDKRPKGETPDGTPKYTQSPRYSEKSAVPRGTMVIACGPGEVIYAEMTPYGATVKIRHVGGNWISYYTHMANLRVQKRQAVVAGTPLGDCWGTPKKKGRFGLFHLHFSVYNRNKRGLTSDPMPFLRKWRVIGAPAPRSQPNVPASTTVGNPVAVPVSTFAEPPQLDMAMYERLKANERGVYQLYAKYEYYRERYAARSGTAHLSWNPYVVPGFPATFFDQRSTRVDVFAYITTVQQRMSHRDRATDITFVYGRTIQEVFGLLRHEFENGSTQLGNAPQEPVKDIKKVAQDFTQAEEMYRRLFFGDRRLYNKDASFDWRKIIGFAPDNPAGLPEPIYVTGRDTASDDAYDEAAQVILAKEPEIQELRKKRAAAQVKWNAASDVLDDLFEPSVWDEEDPQSTSGRDTEWYRDEVEAINALKLRGAEADMNEAQATIEAVEHDLAELAAGITSAVDIVKQKEAEVAVHDVTVTSNVTGDREVVPMPSAEPMFQEYDAAMAYNWRPICTLDEYIIFHDSAGEGPIPAAGHERSLGARYFSRIRRMTPLTPDYQFPLGADGMVVPPPPPVPVSNETKGAGLTQGYVVGDYVDQETLANWPDVEEVFRKAAKKAGLSEKEIEVAVANAKKEASLTPTSVSTSEENAESSNVFGNMAQTVRDMFKQARLTVIAETAAAEHEAEVAAATATTKELASTEGMRQVPGVYSSTDKNVSNKFPQTRADWDTILLAYRNNVYNVKAPRG